MNKLQEWLAHDKNGKFSLRGSGRLTELAKHLELTQPAVTKIVNSGNPINYKYAKQLIEFTGISAFDLFPEWAELFEFSQNQQCEINQQQKEELMQLKSKLQVIIDDI